MGALDPKTVVVNVALDAAPVGKTGFGTPMLLTRVGEKTFAITAVSAGSDTITVAGDQRSHFQAGDKFRIEDSTGNDGFYTVESVSYGGGNTTITVTGDIADSTADGNAIINKAYDIGTWDEGTKTLTISDLDDPDEFPAGLKFYALGDPLDMTLTVVSAEVDGYDLAVVVEEDLPAYSGSGHRAQFAYLEGDASARYKIYSTSAALAATEPNLGETLAAFAAKGFAQSPRAAKIMLGLWLAGESAEDALTAVAAATAEAGASDFYGFTLYGHRYADLKDAADWAEAETKPRVFFGQSAAAAMIASGPSSGIGWYAKANSLKRTLPMYHDDGVAFAWAALCRYFAISPDDRSYPLAYVSLSGVAVKTLTATQIDNIDANRVTAYIDFRGQSVIWRGRMGDNNPLDLRVTADWLQARVAEAISQLFVNMASYSRKIPFTEPGFEMIAGVVRGVLGRGVQAEHLVAGSTQVVMPALSDVDPDDRANRLLRFTFGGQPAGAIEQVVVSGEVSLSFTIATA